MIHTQGELMSTFDARKLVAGLVSVAALLFVSPALASPVTFNVNTTVDGNQANSGTTDCASNSETASGKCTLRSSVQAADNEPAGTDVTINVPAGTYKLSVANPTQPATFSLNTENRPSSIDIAGAGAAKTVVDANFLDRALDISDGPTVTISGLTIEHGRPGGIGNVTDCPTTAQPEADGGGIQTQGDLTLSNDTLRDNIASGGGGGLSDQSDGGTLNVSGSTFLDNKACQPQTQSLDFTRSGGAIDVTLAATTTIDSSIITGNTATQNGNGGGVEFECCSGATVTVTSTTISGNSAFSGGGFGDDAGGAEQFFADTISGNHASNNGGGYQDSNGGTDSFVDSTVRGNSADGDGGGIWETGTATISFSTLTHNTSSGGGNLAVGGESFGAFNIDDSIVLDGAAQSANCNGPFQFTDNGYNLFDFDGGDQCGTPGPHDIVNANPKLGPLQNNGGPTKTEALLAGSPAVDKASDAFCQTEPVPPSPPVSFARDAQSGNPVDQRAITRPQGPHCDIGAFEATPDLGVEGSVEQNPITVGDPTTVTWVVNNSNPADAQNTTFTDPGARFRILSVKPSQGTCTHTKTTIKCQLGLIAPGGHVTIKVVVKGLSPGRIRLNGRSQTTGTDLRQANNRGTVRIRVKSKPKPPPPPPPPPPPRPSRPSIGANHLGAGCHAESASFDVQVQATARAGIRSIVVKVGGRTAKSFKSSSKSTKHKTLVVHVAGRNFIPDHRYTVLARVVDALGRTADVTRHFSMCKPPPPKRGFTG
jgi:hypothetical protein